MARLNWLSVIPALGGLLEPMGGGGIVGLLLAAAGDQHAQVVHGADVALVGRPAVPDLGPLRVGGDADAALVVGAEAELG